MLNPPNIVILDDNPDNLETLRDALETRGYLVRTSQDGEAGLAEILREPPQLVIVDMLMPTISGFTIVKKLLNRLGRQLPILMVSAISGSAHQAYARALGVTVFLEKPFGLSELIDQVHTLCPITLGTAPLASESTSRLESAFAFQVGNVPS